jgi:hypothetical protein
VIVLRIDGSSVEDDPIIKKSRIEYSGLQESNHATGRRLDTVSYASGGFANIRIHLSFDDALISLSAEKRTFLTKLAGAAVAYWEAALLVRPVQGNITLQPTCELV